jgi:hypothetical protein
MHAAQTGTHKIRYLPMTRIGVYLVNYTDPRIVEGMDQGEKVIKRETETGRNLYPG